MRYFLYSIVAALAATALFPVMKKAGRYLLSLFKKIEEAAAEDVVVTDEASKSADTDEEVK